MSERVYADGENYNYPLLIKKLLKTPLIYSPDNEIVYSDKNRYNYRTFHERIGSLANSLKGMGLKEGDIVAVFDYDSHRYFECFFAIPMMGSVLQTINWRLSNDQITYTINHSGASVIIINSVFLPVLESIFSELDAVKIVIVINEDENLIKAEFKIDGDYEDLLQKASSSFDFPDFDENTKATTFYTTGTTGNPKGVYFSHRQIMLHTMAVSIVSGSYDTIGRFRSGDVYMPLTPMFHVHAWGYPYIATLLGTKQVYPGQYEPEKLLQLIKNEKVTYSHCVPTILQMILNCPSVKDYDLSRWKVVIGGSRLSKGLARAAIELGIEIHAGYGMSETCPVVTSAAPSDYMHDWEKERLLDVTIKTGKPLPLVDLEIFDAGEKPVPHDGVSTGEVVMRTPWLTESYFNEPERTKELWRSGWLHSGDVGHIDEDGYLQITDRIKDVIKTGGEWVSSLDLENLISQHEAVLESAAIGIPDKKWGERPMMIVSLKEEFKGKVTADDLKKFMENCAGEGKLPKYGIPDTYEFMENIPKTSVGKLDKKVLRKLFT